MLRSTKLGIDQRRKRKLTACDARALNSRVGLLCTGQMVVTMSNKTTSLRQSVVSRIYFLNPRTYGNLTKGVCGSYSLEACHFVTGRRRSLINPFPFVSESIQPTDTNCSSMKMHFGVKFSKNFPKGRIPAKV
jgi:hypothetical protein